MKRILSVCLTNCLLFFTSSQAALSDLGNLTVKSGAGEEITVRHGIFGHKETIVKDRLGDSYISKKGLFGGKDTQVNILGNTVKVHKGIFGNSKASGSSILGDSFSSEKNFWRRRNTSVDLSGMNGLLKHFTGQGQDPLQNTGQTSGNAAGLGKQNEGFQDSGTFNQEPNVTQPMPMNSPAN